MILELLILAKRKFGYKLDTQKKAGELIGEFGKRKEWGNNIIILLKKQKRSYIPKLTLLTKKS